MKTTFSSHRQVRMICEGAVMVAAAQVLGYIKLWEMPWGGSICLSILQFTLDGGFALGWQSIIGDYLVAYTVVGLAGLFRGKGWSIYAGTAAGSLARFLVHYVVGATIWAEYMPETFFGMTMTTPWFYSMLYNGFYMAIDMALCLLVFALAAKPMKKYYLGQDLAPAARGEA